MLAAALLAPAAGAAQDRDGAGRADLPGQTAGAAGVESPVEPLREPVQAGEAQVELGGARIDASLLGEPIASVELTCDLALCDNPIAVDRLRELSALYVGQPLTRRAVERAEERLAKTGFFASVVASARPATGGVAVDIEAEGAVLIRRVEFVGVDPPPFTSDLRKLLMYRQGQPYGGERAKAVAQLRTLKEEFEKEGYFGTTIDMYVRPVDELGHLVDISFRIEKGEEFEICDIGFRGLRSLTYNEARELLLADLSIFARRLEVVAPTFTTRGFKAGQEALLNRYRDLGYFQARIVNKTVQQRPEQGCVVVLVDLLEGPRWDVEFTGETIFDAEDLREQLPFNESGYVDQEEIERAERALRKFYETRGYPFATVTGQEIRRDRLDRLLAFEIDPGPRLEIREVSLHGNEEVSDAELTSSFGTRVFGLFEKGGFLQVDQLLGDFRKIEQAYHQRGYLQALVERFALEVDAQAEALRIHIWVDEGPRSRIARLRIDGNRHLSNSLITKKLEGQQGTPFVPLQVRADTSRIVQRYASFGYPLAEVETTCRLMTGEVVPCGAPSLPATCVADSLEQIEGQCRWTDGPLSTRVCQRRLSDVACDWAGGVTRQQVRVEHVVTEGPFVRVSQMLLKGNFRTDRDLIFQELPLRTGDVFDVSKVLEGQGNMRSLGVFDSVSIEAIGLDEEARQSEETTAALIISVEESRARYLDFRFGVEGRDLLDDGRRLLLTGETTYNDINLFGRAQRFRPRLIGAFDSIELFEFGTETAETGDASQIDELNYLVGAELVYNHPRWLKGLTGIDKLSLTVAPFYMLDLLGVTTEDVLREEWGLRAEVRKELDEILERLFVSFGIEGKQAALWSPGDPTRNGERVFSPRRVTGKLIPEVTLDRRDSPLNPREGYYAQFTPEIVSGATLVSAGGEDAIKDAYVRLLVTTNYYLRLFDDVVFGQGVRFGHIIPFLERETLVTEDERFRLGGAGSVRGYPTNALGPLLDDQPTGGEFMVNYNAELRYPLIAAANLYGALFFDAGILADCFNEDRSERISCIDDAFGGDQPWRDVRTAAGLGIRYLIVDQIPVVLDYGMALDRRPGETFGQLHFSLGYTF